MYYSLLLYHHSFWRIMMMVIKTHMNMRKYMQMMSPPAR